MALDMSTGDRYNCFYAMANKYSFRSLEDDAYVARTRT